MCFGWVKEKDCCAGFLESFFVRFDYLLGTIRHRNGLYYRQYEYCLTCKYLHFLFDVTFNVGEKSGLNGEEK